MLAVSPNVVGPVASGGETLLLISPKYVALEPNVVLSGNANNVVLTLPFEFCDDTGVSEL
jgi:hypothetical protein